MLLILSVEEQNVDSWRVKNFDAWVLVPSRPGIFQN